MGGWGQVFELFAGKDVESSQMNFGVTVFARLRGSHVDNLAGAAFDNDEAILSQGRTLHRVSSGGAGIGTFEGMLMLPKTQSATRISRSRRKIYGDAETQDEDEDEDEDKDEDKEEGVDEDGGGGTKCAMDCSTPYLSVIICFRHDSRLKG